mmetsp:Transcript_41057/g.41939  ORF Transcript_41057/g.41939 Transcript_41057/m.41939 type:complete len:1015 (+) Transcript_41057:17-3061(+)
MEEIDQSSITLIKSRLTKIEASMSAREARLDDIEKKLESGVSTQAEIEWPANKVRQAFFDYFVEKRGHILWPSSPVVPVNDPTLMFANAGMNQYKPLFLGTCDPSLEMSKLTMAVNSQKCIRAGGKHNDLDDVGKDVYHHTFFEMLGNWSFGSYFKEEAISWAMECLIDVFKMDINRIYATYFGGDDKLGLPPDEEARQIWLKFLPANRILPFSSKDNFWEMGATGPCGPCSEIHYDRIGDRDAAQRVNADVPDVIEIWNVVFMQFNREADGSLKELPAKHVDTGMGFERLTSVLQGKQSNYDTDIFNPIFEEIQKLVGCRAYQGLVGEEDVDLIDTAYRVVADHIRTLTFAITDGAVPSSEGRGYVLRRILRRAVRYGQEILSAPAGFFTGLVPIVIEKFSEAYPELASRQDLVKSIISEEEVSFNRTLDLGVKHFKKVVSIMEKESSHLVPAKDAHILFTSMGFPLDLTELMARERGLEVDSAGFAVLMEQDRRTSELAEAMRRGGGMKDMSMEAEQTAWLQSKGIETTDSSAKYIWNQKLTSRIVALFEGRGGAGAGFRDSISGSDGQMGVILSATSFYYESGGQVSDTGLLVLDGAKFRVDAVQSYAGYVVHTGEVVCGSLSVDLSVVCEVNYDRRSFVAPNHTMTHVLNFALRSALLKDGENAQGLCDQKGSLVDAEKLRFDFAWSGALTPAQVAQVEGIVVEKIKSAIPIFSELVPLGDASGIQALRCLFGEQYPDPVRVISVGNPLSVILADPKNSSWKDFSIEFCGGTHLSNTKDAEDFVLVEETGIAKGVRRIVGLTRNAARDARLRAKVLLERLRAIAAMTPGAEMTAMSKAIKLEVDQAVVSLVDKESMRKELTGIANSLKAYNKSLSATRTASAMTAIETIASEAAACSKPVVVQAMEFGADGKVAKKIQDKYRAIYPDGTLFLASLDDDEEKMGLYPLVASKHVSSGLSAKEWCDHCISVVGSGKGGGKADMANATIPGNSEMLKKVLETAFIFSQMKLKI